MKKELNIQIGSRVKAARDAAGYTQERLAELLDVSCQFISGVERGVVGLSIPVLIRLCDILLVSCDDILLGKRELTDTSGIAYRMSSLPPKHVKNAELLLDRYVEGIAIAKYDESEQ